jgi:hypothetical protein
MDYDVKEFPIARDGEGARRILNVPEGAFPLQYFSRGRVLDQKDASGMPLVAQDEFVLFAIPRVEVKVGRKRQVKGKKSR